MKRIIKGCLIVSIFLFPFFSKTVFASNASESSKSLVSGTDRFPAGYDVKSVLIHYHRITMFGGLDIVIFGDGSAYYVKIGEDSYARFGKISEITIKEIVNLFMKDQFLNLRDKYPEDDNPYLPNDMGTDYVSFTINGMTKTVDDYGRSAPESLHEIINVLLSSVENLLSVKAEEKITFCSTIRREVDKIPVVRSTEGWMTACCNAVDNRGIDYGR